MVYETVIGKFDSYFKVLIRRNQLQGESAEQYIMELYKLAETCDYGTFTEELI